MITDGLAEDEAAGLTGVVAEEAPKVQPTRRRSRNTVNGAYAIMEAVAEAAEEG